MSASRWAATALGLAAALAPARVPAQALPFHTDTAITAGFQENAARVFAGFLGREGLVADGEDVSDPAARELDARILVAGTIPYAFTPFWTVGVVVPWIDKSFAFDGPDGRRLEFDTSGVGDILIDTPGGLVWS